MVSCNYQFVTWLPNNHLNKILIYKINNSICYALSIALTQALFKTVAVLI